MADLTLKKIEEVLDRKFDQELRPIKKVLDEHTQRLDSLLLDMIDVQKKTDILPDLHSYIKETKEKVDEHDERIQRLENAA